MVWKRYRKVHNLTQLSPWYNRTGWLGVKHQLTYLLTQFVWTLTVTALLWKRYRKVHSLPQFVWTLTRLHYQTFRRRCVRENPWPGDSLQVEPPILCPAYDAMSARGLLHTPSIAFRHFPPNSARLSYATVGAHSIFAQLSTDAVSALRKVWVLIRL